MAMIPEAFGLLALAPPAWAGVYGAWAQARWPAEGRFVDALGARAHVVDRGEGPPVVLLHGASGSTRDVTAPLAPRLEGVRTIAVDRPFHGHSGGPKGAWRLGTQAAFVAEALRAAGLDRPATVVGHSWGAAVALRLALDVPELVKALVLLAPASHPYPGGTALYNRLAAAPGLGPLIAWTIPALVGPLVLGRGLANAFAPSPVPSDYVRDTGIPLYFRARTFAANSRDMTASNRELAAQAPRYGLIQAPLAVISGEGDRVVANKIHAAGLARDIAHAERHTIAKGGHMPQHVDPEAVAAVIRRLAAA